LRRSSSDSERRIASDAPQDRRGSLPALPAGALAMRWPIYRFHRHQGSTNDCGPFCVVIAVNALKGKSLLNGSGVARQMERCRPCAGSLPLPVLDKIPGWATLPWGLSDELRRHGVPSRWRFMGTRERLLSNLRTDRITLISVGEPLRFDRGRWRGWGHVKILYAWAPGHGWAFVDLDAAIHDRATLMIQQKQAGNWSPAPSLPSHQFSSIRSSNGL